MCIIDYGFVIMGFGLWDGRIVVWKFYFVDIFEFKMSKGVCLEEIFVCEVDGFEMVNRKDMVQLDMDQKYVFFI